MRIPRPRNMTYNSINYNKTNDNQFYQEMIQTIINEYTTSNFTLNKQPYSLQQISDHYNIPLDLLYTKLTKRLSDTQGFINQEDLLDAHRVILNMVISETIGDKAHVASQLHRLLAAQGESYRPFISGEVNNTLKLMLTSTSNLINVLDKVLPKNTEIIAMLVDAKQSAALSSYEATKLIRSEVLGHQDTKALPPGIPKDQFITDLAEVYQEHNLADMPNVRANQGDAAANINVKAKQILEANETAPPLPELD